MQWRIQGAVGAAAPPLLAHIFFEKAAFSVCAFAIGLNEDGRPRPAPFKFLDPPLSLYSSELNLMDLASCQL